MPLVKYKTRTHCRIGKVTLKHKPIVAFPSRIPQGKAQAKVNPARECIKATPQLDGYIVIAFKNSGGYSLRIDHVNRRSLIDMPRFAEE